MVDAIESVEGRKEPVDRAEARRLQLSSRNQIFQQTFADNHNSGALNVALSGTVVIVAVAVATITAFGPEAKGADLS